MRALITFLRPLQIAVQFLTCLPVSSTRAPQNRELGASLLWYPVVGALLGTALYVLAEPLRVAFGDWLAAALLLLIWVGLTGALHLDGLADSADAWMGGLGSRKRTLELMKDPTCGPMAVVVLVLLLVLKLAALAVIVSHESAWALFWPPILARTVTMLLFTTTRYARNSGLGSDIKIHHNANGVWMISVVVLMIAAFMLGWPLILAQLLFCGALFLTLRYMMVCRIGGFTGDTAGALLELTELVALLVFVVCLRIWGL